MKKRIAALFLALLLAIPSAFGALEDADDAAGLFDRSGGAKMFAEASSANAPCRSKALAGQTAWPEAAPERPGPWTRFVNRLEMTWKSDQWDVYVPVYTWHNRLFYDQEHIDRYNENPWGAGLGRSMIDEDGDTHSLFIIGFMDSNDHFEPFGGYAFMKNYYLDKEKDWAVSIGYTLGITARHEYSYIPLPLPLPLVGAQYKNFAIQAAYVPGTKNNGNVLFTWVRWHFD